MKMSDGARGALFGEIFHTQKLKVNQEKWSAKFENQNKKSSSSLPLNVFL